MSEYQLQIKQVVEAPRCRIYRQFIQSLANDRSFHMSGGSHLFYYALLCSYASSRTVTRHLDGISYTIYPGEWICTRQELSTWFRVRFPHQAWDILSVLQNKHLISFLLLDRGKVIKYKIRNWNRNNTVLGDNCPCQKDVGYFFLPFSIAAELISVGRCSEMDVVLDLWMYAVYRDERVQGSENAPVVYLRNGTGCPLVSYQELAARWGISKATVGRILKRLVEKEYLSLMSFPGWVGSVIYLQNYLSTMFQISDVLLDKEEVAMLLNIPVSFQKEDTTEEDGEALEQEVCVSEDLPSVSKSQIAVILQKMAKVLGAQGISCFQCPKSRYQCFPLSAGRGEKCVIVPQELEENCFGVAALCGKKVVCRFELMLSPIEKGRYTGRWEI